MQIGEFQSIGRLLGGAAAHADIAATARQASRATHDRAREEFAAADDLLQDVNDVLSRLGSNLPSPLLDAKAAIDELHTAVRAGVAPSETTLRAAFQWSAGWETARGGTEALSQGRGRQWLIDTLEADGADSVLAARLLACDDRSATQFGSARSALLGPWFEHPFRRFEAQAELGVADMDALLDSSPDASCDDPLAGLARVAQIDCSDTTRNVYNERRGSRPALFDLWAKAVGSAPQSVVRYAGGWRRDEAARSWLIGHRASNEPGMTATQAGRSLDAAVNDRESRGVMQRATVVARTAALPDHLRPRIPDVRGDRPWPLLAVHEIEFETKRELINLEVQRARAATRADATVTAESLATELRDIAARSTNGLDHDDLKRLAVIEGLPTTLRPKMPGFKRSRTFNQKHLRSWTDVYVTPDHAHATTIDTNLQRLRKRFPAE